jgi:site-specific recombinase XerD
MKKTNPHAILSQTLERIEGAYAPATVRAFKADFNAFIQYCEKLKLSALPANPFTTSAYIDHLAKSDFTSAYIRRIIASIASIHKLNRLEDPTKDRDVQLATRKMHRLLGRNSQQVAGITKPLLEKMTASLDDSLRGIRDKALLLVAYDTLCRRSELVNLLAEDITWTEIKINSQQIASIKLRKSKTDQCSQGKWLHLSHEASLSLDEWLTESAITIGPIFRGITRGGKVTGGLGCGQIARIYKRIATEAKIDSETIKHISGHSMRIGAAQDLLISGASLPIIMNRGRWSKVDTVMRYVEQIHMPL